MRKLLAALVAFLISTTALAFSDVSDGHPNEQAIDYLARHNVIAGYPDGTFQPSGKINRAELIKIVTGARGTDPAYSQYHECFNDVWWDWYARYVCYAKQQNWIGGYSDWTFRPGNYVNRAEAAKIILNALGVGFTDSQKYGDVDQNAWYAPFANTVRSRELLSSADFLGSYSLTRGEAAEMIFRILALKQTEEDVYNSSVALKFDVRYSPDEILRGTNEFDYSNSTEGYTNLQITPWSISGGAWAKKPALMFNGNQYEFDTPQEYIDALEEIQEHFRVVGRTSFNATIERLISEFRAVVGSYGTTSTSTSTAPATTTTSGGSLSSNEVGWSVDLTGVDLTNESAVKAKGGVFAQRNNTTIYIGHESLPPTNRNPVLVSFTNGVQDWVRRDYETSSEVSVGYGLLWAGPDKLFAVFTSDGAAEDMNRDFRRFAKYGWLSEYGTGEGKDVAVVAKINPDTGDIYSATFLSSRQDSGETSSLTVTGLAMNGDNLVVSAEAWYAPRRINGQPMDLYPNAENAPYDYTIEFTPDLQTAVRAEAPGFGM